MNDEERKNHTYLGDGLYAESTQDFIILRANDHRDEFCTDKVYLEDGVLIRLIEWIAHLKEIPSQWLDI